MKLSEIVELVKIMSGQKEFDLDELLQPDYETLFRLQVLPIVSKKLPFKKEIEVDITSSPYTFVDPDIPEWISEVTPIDQITPTGTLQSLLSSSVDLGGIDKPLNLTKYVKPDLFLQNNGKYLITTQHCIKLVDLDPVVPGDFDIINIEEKNVHYLTDLLLGYTLLSVGRSRRAVTMAELPYTFDAGELVAEGKELVDSTILDLSSHDNWWEAVV